MIEDNESYEEKMHTYIKSNKLLLTKKQIEILNNYNIDYTKDVKFILYQIDQYLNDDYNQELDELACEIAENDYYNNTNK